MDINWWSALLLVSKWAGYLGTAGAIGGPFALILLSRLGIVKRILGYSLIACVLGAIAAVIGFFLQVGSFADQGIGGMFELTYATILWQSAVGKAVLLRVVGFGIVAGGLALIGRTVRGGVHGRPALASAAVLVAVGIGSVAASFQYVGHTVDEGALARTAVFVHVIAIGLWAGSLYPLWLACRASPAFDQLAELQQGMVLYGKLAAGIVAVLVLCGVILLYGLFDSVAALTGSAYGWGLLAKLGLVAAMLMIAASNKWLWVAGLLRQRSSRYLSRSVTAELAVGLLILLVTAFVTTFVGPAH